MANVGARCLCTLDEARDFLKRKTTDDDDAITMYADMCTALVEKRTARRLKSRTYDGAGGNEPKMLLNGTGSIEIQPREYPLTAVTVVTASALDGSILRTLNLTGARIIDGGRFYQAPLDYFDKGQANITMTCVAGYLAGVHDRELVALKAATLRWIQVLWQDKDLAVGRGANIAVGGESLSFLGDAVPNDIMAMLSPFERW